MSRLADLLLKEDRTDSETDELRKLVDDVQFATDDVSGLFGPTGQIRSLKAGAVELDSEGFKTATRQVVIDRGGVQLGPSGAAASSIIWLAEVGGTQIGSILTTVVGSSPDRYGLLAIRAEPESGTTDANAQGLITISAYDHDGSADDVRRNLIQAGAGTTTFRVYNTSGTQLGEINFAPTEAAFNEDGDNYDTRFEGDSVDDVLKVDAGLDQVLVGTTIAIKERAASQADTANYGQLWVKDDDPNILRYTDGDGAEFIVNMTAV